MSERKVLNKYYPPDFDPSKLPKLKLSKERQYVIRTMAPFNMRCKTCGEYIYKGKKFNSRKETVQGETYLGLRIFRFYIKCPRCLAEITFKTDLQNCDYQMEHGATRNFEAERLAHKQAEQEQKEKEEEIANNPMLVLEKRTNDSRLEMERLEQLEELREMNVRHATLDNASVLDFHNEYEKQLQKLQDEEDESFVRSVFGKGEQNADTIRRLEEDSDDEDDQLPVRKRLAVSASGKPTDILAKGPDTPIRSQQEKPKKQAWEKSIGVTTTKGLLAGLVKPKKSSQIRLVQPVAGTEVAACTVQKEHNDKGIVDGTSITNKTQTDTNTSVVPSDSNSKVTMATTSGLGLLGNYSDSDSSSGNEGI
ncbi:PREDICTED: coiled-coil domain-containing protein 94-like [Priapulus caudatus]|uniref:Splicing factor YJU2 n=1 Tax=Priapulus caudatus TaxID=37621 RepID=A0ABM1DXL6_PRICU|nr:PREDICTED: coiled-coil domain-containing protein 94-like [Priapulus caudatus]